MKKDSAMLLAAVTLLFTVFVAGFFIGRHMQSTPAAINKPTDSKATATSAAATDSNGHSVKTKLNVNTATAEQLDALPGIGPVLAGRIIEYRRQNGSFTSISQLADVQGIGQERLIAIMEYITVEETYEDTGR